MSTPEITSPLPQPAGSYQSAMVDALHRVQAVVEFDLNGYVLHANERFLNIFGYTSPELLGRHHSLFCDPVYSASAEYTNLWARLGRGEFDAGEYRRVAKNGEDVWIQSSYSPIFDPAGQPYKVVKFATDITARKRSEILLSNTRHALEISNFAARIGTWECDVPSLNMNWSNMTRQLFGAEIDTRTDLKTLLNLLQNPWKLQEALDHAIDHDTGWDLELLITPLQGETIWVRLIGQAERELGVCTRLFGTVQDIDRSKRRELELAQAREVAEAASRSKDLFLATMSHELRTPMNAILGFSQMLEIDDELNTDQLENVHEVLKAGRHLLDLINDVLDLAKVSAGRIEVSMESVAVHELLEDCGHLIGPLAASYQIGLDLPDSGTLQVQADRIRLKQVLLNLLSNAIKYNRPAGRVQVRVDETTDHQVRIRVMDTGLGIARQDLSQVFEPFVRLVAEDSTIEGTGIGLSITRQLVEFMKGQIGVDSEVGTGSTFWITLPRIEPRTKLETSDLPTPDEAQAPVQQPRQVLYIDDNPVNLKLVRRIVTGLPQFEIQTTHLPDVGLELARSNPPDLILLDINMPGMDGYEVLKELRTVEALRRIPIMAVTASAMPREIERGLLAGFSHYFTKPLDIPDFINKIKHFTQIGAAEPLEATP